MPSWQAFFDMVDFKNIEQAFGHRSNKTMRFMHLLFGLMNRPMLVEFATKWTLWSLRLKIPIEWILKKTIFKQFCGGETIHEAIQCGIQLEKRGIGAILDFAVEGVESQEAYDANVSEILKTIDAAQQHGRAIPFAVFKVTGVCSFDLLAKVQANKSLSEAEKLDVEKAKARVDHICRYAASKKVTLLIDAEESWIQTVIDELVEKMMFSYNTHEAYIYTTCQMYRHDRLEYIQQMYHRLSSTQRKVGVKLVRGAYMEKENNRARELEYVSPIHPNKPAVDADFNKALEFMMQRLEVFSICLGTHNEHSCLHAISLLHSLHRHPSDSKLWFAQLYGMGDHISYNLAHNSYNVAKYVPYGPVRAVVPYLLRRAKENTSIAGQSSREFTLIKQEILRRKKSM